MVRPDLVTRDRPPDARPWLLLFDRRAAEEVEPGEQPLAGLSPEDTAGSEDWLETARAVSLLPSLVGASEPPNAIS